MIKKYCKVRDCCHFTSKYRGAAHNGCNLKHIRPKEIPVVFDNAENCDYQFIIIQLLKKFEGEFSCLGEYLVVQETKKNA